MGERNLCKSIDRANEKNSRRKKGCAGYLNEFNKPSPEARRAKET